MGWAVSSALPDAGSNTILYGHNNLHASIFLHLADLQPGDRVTLITGETRWQYTVNQVQIVPVPTAAADRAVFNRIFKATRAPRLTIVSCWPPVSNTHRVIVVAYPAQ